MKIGEKGETVWERKDTRQTGESARMQGEKETQETRMLEEVTGTEQ